MMQITIPARKNEANNLIVDKQFHTYETHTYLLD